MTVCARHGASGIRRLSQQSRQGSGTRKVYQRHLEKNNSGCHPCRHSLTCNQLIALQTATMSPCRRLHRLCQCIGLDILLENIPAAIESLWRTPTCKATVVADMSMGASSHVEGQYRLDCSCSLRKFFFDHHTMQSLTRSHKRRDGTRCDLDQDLINLVPVVRGRPC